MHSNSTPKPYLTKGFHFLDAILYSRYDPYWVQTMQPSTCKSSVHHDFPRKCQGVLPEFDIPAAQRDIYIWLCFRHHRLVDHPNRLPCLIHIVCRDRLSYPRPYIRVSSSYPSFLAWKVSQILSSGLHGLKLRHNWCFVDNLYRIGIHRAT